MPVWFREDLADCCFVARWLKEVAISVAKSSDVAVSHNNRRRVADG